MGDTGDTGRGFRDGAASHRRLNGIYLSSCLHIWTQRVDYSFRNTKTVCVKLRD